MPVLGRRPALTLLPSGESLVVITEAAQCSLPSFLIQSSDSTQKHYLIQDSIYPLGSRLTYSLISTHGRDSLPVPILCQFKDASSSAQPLPVFPLHNAVDPSIAFDPAQKRVHLLWWWNAWTPAEGQPVPPENFYLAHSVPDLQSPAWLRSLVPKAQPAAFDVTEPFWIAPIAEGYQFDYFPENSIIMGESRANGPARMPDTPGGRWLQGSIVRGLVNYPGPPEASFGAVPSPERDAWERRGGIVAAGEHIRLASLRDRPEFIPVPGQNPYTHELEAAHLPGVGQTLPATTTWEDHLIIINALKAHYDHANLINSTRVLMYATGYLLDMATLETIPKPVLISGQSNSIIFRGPVWPPNRDRVQASLVILEFPRVVGAFPSLTNYRTMINPDKIRYPLLDYPDIGTSLVSDGFLVDGASPHLQQEPAVDWVVADPTDPCEEFQDMYRNHLDNRSY
jgi:hypothetical protein